VDRRIDLSNLDLDVAASLVAERRPVWLRSGLSVRAVTWMDNDAEWPRPLLIERSRVRRPMSLGVRVDREEPYGEAEFVLYAGGWADVDYVAAGSDAVVSEYVELDDAQQFGSILDRVVAQLLVP
jgi:hypothetical protein